MRILRRAQGGGRAADCARRYRRRVAGRAGHRARSPNSPMRRSVARCVICCAVRRGKLKVRDSADPEEGSGYVVLAMGKVGAFELNYSSDIDLIVLYDADAAPLEGAEPGSFFARITRGLVKLMQERTVDGYVFRTDLRLRPDPASTPVAISLVSALNYYESTGQNWERAAMIKARPCAGDLALGETFLREVAPFVWRKYLDYGAVADVHAMKRQMAAYKGHDEIAIEGPQHQARARRHPRDRVLRADPAADRGRPASGTARPRRRWSRWRTSPRAAGSAARRRATWPRPTASCARSSTGCRWWPTSRPTRCRTSARRSSGSRAFSGLPTATPSRPCCSSICARCSATMRGCSRMRPPPRPRAARSRFPPDKDDTDDARQARRDGLPPPARSQSARCGAGSRANTARSRASSRARILPSWCRC